jgi:hypothetical protein
MAQIPMLLLLALLNRRVVSDAVVDGGHMQGLQYFGFWGDQSADGPNSTAAFTNLHLPYGCRTGLCHASEFPPSARQLSLAPVRWLLWNCSTTGQTNGGLKTNWRDEWSAARQHYAPMVANGTVGGFMLGDELVWQGCTVDALTTMAEVIHADFPSTPIYYNENVPVVLHGVNSAGYAVNFTVPPAVTWFSFDYYHYDGATDETHVDTVREVYEQHVYPKLLPHQRVLLCPGAFAMPPGMPIPGGFACNMSCFDAMRASDAAFYFDWARADKRIVGLAAWEWNDAGDRLGAMNLPQTRLAWGKIGRQILKTDRLQSVTVG